MKVRKPYLFILIGWLIFSPIANAASPKITVKTLQPSGFLLGVSDIATFAVNGNSILMLDSDTLTATNPVLRALSSDGSEKWRLALDSANQSIATAITVDSTGNVWAVGASSIQGNATLATPESATAQPLMPDPFQLDLQLPLRADLTVLTIWQVSSTGVLLQKFTKDLNFALLPTSLSVSGTQVGVIGTLAHATGQSSIYIKCLTTGTCSSALSIGKSDAELTNLLQRSDGSALILGSSSSSILKEKINGKRDAFAISLSKSSVIIQVLRSSNKASFRSWSSATENLYFGGSAVLGKKSEAVMTKFDVKLQPQWTQRFLSGGSALVLSIDGKKYLSAFTSTAAIPQLANWKPKSPQLLVLQNDLKGIMQGGYALKGANQGRYFGYSPDLGAIVIANVGDRLAIFPSISR